MALDPVQLGIAIQIDLAWGPEMRRPVVDRVLERLPSITRREAEALAAEASTIASEAFALAERAYHGDGFDEHTGRAELERRFPHLDSSTLDNLWWKGGYYAWHG